MSRLYNKKYLQEKIKDIFAFFSSIYLVLVSTSLLLYFFDKPRYKPIKIIKSSSEQIKNAIKIGYHPYFFPATLKSEVKNNEFYPIGSFPYTKTYLCDEGYGLVKFKTDRFGLRNKNSNWLNVKNQQNIFLIGDSFAQGACVMYPKSIAGILNKETKLNTINLASAGNGSYEYLAILKSIIKPIISNSNYKNYVIIAFYENDKTNPNTKINNFIEQIPEIVVQTKEGEIMPSEFYINKMNKIKKLKLSKMFNQSNKLKFNKVKKYKDSFLYQNLTFVPVRTRFNELNNLKSASEQSIEMLSEICQQKCIPIITYIPGSEYFFQVRRLNYYKNFLKEQSEKYGLTFIDGSKVINSKDRNDFAPNGPHLSNQGYKKLTELIIEKI